MKRLVLLPFAIFAPWVTCAGDQIITAGAADRSAYVRIINEDGTAQTGVTAATAGLDLEYVRGGAAAVDLTESNLGSPAAAHTDGGLIHVGWGLYRVDLPDAAVATGADRVIVGGSATGMTVIPDKITLTAFDLQATQAATVQQMARAVSDYSRVLFVRTDGNNGNDGFSPATAKATPAGALAIAADGDLVLIGVGTFDQDWTPLTVPAGVALVGAGKFETRLIGHYNGYEATGFHVRVTDRCRVANLTIEPDLEVDGGSLDAQRNREAIELYGTTAKGVLIENCVLRARYDSIMFRWAGTSQALVRDCLLWSTYDCLGIVYTNADVRIERSQMMVREGDQWACGIAIRQTAGSGKVATCEALDCEIDVDVPDTVFGAAAVHLDKAENCSVRLLGGAIRATAGDDEAFDIRTSYGTDPSGTVYVSGAVYDPAKISGDVVVAPVPDHALRSEWTAVRAEYVDKLDTSIPAAAPGASGGLPTVDANNRVAGIAGTLNNFDQLDAAQNAQHAATIGEAQSARTAAEAAALDTNQLLLDVANVPTVAELNARTLTSAAYATAGAQSGLQADISSVNAKVISLGTTLNLVVADTNELQSDWTNGGRLDLKVDDALASVNSLPTAVATASAVRNELATELGRIDAAISSRLPTSGYTAPPAALDYVTALNSDVAYQALLADAQALNDVKLTTARANRLDYLDMPLSGVGSAGLPRINEPPANAYTVKVATRSDGTHECPTPIRIRPGATNVAIGINMSPLYGDVRVTNVGTPVVSGGNVTATALGPHDWIAMVQLGGTATAGERRTISVPITMRTGEVEVVDVKLWVFAE